MEITTHQVNNLEIAEINATGLIIKNTEDGLNLLGDLYYQGFDKIIIHEQNITPDFFDLKNGIAGEILQKFSNYRVRLTIIGDFNKYASKSLQDFIYESNNGKQVNFLTSIEIALQRFIKS